MQAHSGFDKPTTVLGSLRGRIKSREVSDTNDNHIRLIRLKMHVDCLLATADQ